MIPKTEIYYASRKTASAHVYITKNGHGKVRVNNIPLEMIEKFPTGKGVKIIG